MKELARDRLAIGAEERANRQQLAELQRELAAATQARAEAEKAAALLKQRDSLPAPASILTIHLGDILKDHPDYAALLARDHRRNALRQYGPGLATLNLPPDKLAKLKDLLVERTLSSDDAQLAAEAAGLARGTSAWRAAIKQAADSVDEEIGSVVGIDGKAVLDRLQQLASARVTIQFNYAPDLDDAGLPLTGNQPAGLQRAVAAANERVANMTPAQQQGYYKPDAASGLSESNRTLLADAAQVLDPAQLEVFKAGLIKQNQQTAILRQYMTPGHGVSIVP